MKPRHWRMLLAVVIPGLIGLGAGRYASRHNRLPPCEADVVAAEVASLRAAVTSCEEGVSSGHAEPRARP